MDRRDFVAAALSGTGAFVLGGANPSASQAPAGRPAQSPATEYYELRHYKLRRGPGQALVDGYLHNAALPAFLRAGASPVGIFSIMIGLDSPGFYVLLVHKTLDAFAALPSRLSADAEYQTAAAPYLSVEATAPAFVRIESSLMRSFEGMPKLEVPFGGPDAPKRSRIFELRTYESHSERAAQKKIEMFNSGEIAIFRRAGLTPVFFGETLIGPELPNLTYMLVYEDMAAHDKQWSAFSADPEWKKLSTTPGFTDPEIVSNISNVYLRPTAYSQI